MYCLYFLGIEAIVNIVFIIIALCTDLLQPPPKKTKTKEQIDKEAEYKKYGISPYFGLYFSPETWLNIAKDVEKKKNSN